MINITSADLEKLELIDKGLYGVIYRNGDMAYKIYNPYLNDNYNGCKNSMLNYKDKRRRINRMIRLDKELEYTDLCRDVIFLDGKYAGICIPYYDGKTLDNIKDSNFKLRMDISRQLVERSKELTRFHIYPFDYKPDNIMVVDGKVKLLDLDDLLTQYRLFPSIYCSRVSIKRLDETIKDFMGELDICNYYPLVMGLDLDKPMYEANYSYKGITRYLDDKDFVRNFIIVDYKLLDDEVIKKLLQLRDYKVIITYPADEYIFVNSHSCVDRFMESNGKVFDFVEYERLDRYLRKFNVGEVLDYNGQFIKRKNA